MRHENIKKAHDSFHLCKCCVKIVGTEDRNTDVFTVDVFTECANKTGEAREEKQSKLEVKGGDRQREREIGN